MTPTTPTETIAREPTLARLLEAIRENRGLNHIRDLASQLTAPSEGFSDTERDARRYRKLLSQMKIGAVRVDLPLYRVPYLIVHEPCDSVAGIEAAIDAAISAESGGDGDV